MDTSVLNLAALSHVHVWELPEGTTAWVDSEDAFFVLYKSLGASADGFYIVVPIAGAPIAGFAGACWVRGGSGSGNTLVGPTGSASLVNNVTLFDDFFNAGTTIGPIGWSMTGSTSGGLFIDESHFGTRANSVAANGSTASAQMGSAPDSHFVLDGSPVYVETLVRLPLLSDGTNDYLVRFGIGDTSAGNEHLNGAWFDYNVANSPNWRVNTADAGVYTRTVTSVIVPQDTWVKLGVNYVPGASRRAEFYVNGVLVGIHSAATDSFPATTFALTAYYNMLKTAGATARLFWQDYFLLQYRLDPSR